MKNPAGRRLVSRHPRSRAWVALCAIALSIGGCASWHPVRPVALRDQQDEIRLRTVRFGLGGQREVELVVHRVRFPYVEGHDTALGRERRITLTNASSIRVRRPNYGGTVAVVLGVTAGVVGLFALVINALASINIR